MSEYSRELNRGLGLAQNELNSLKDMKLEIKNQVEIGDTASDINYYLKLKGENRIMFEEKYDELVESDVVNRIFGKDIPDFNDVYSGDKSFESSGMKFSLKDLNNLVLFDNMTKVDSTFLKKMFNKGGE